MDSRNRFDQPSSGTGVTLPIIAKLGVEHSNKNVNDEWYILELPHYYQMRQGEKWGVSINSATLFFENLDCESRIAHILLRELTNTLFPSMGSNILCSISNLTKTDENSCVTYENVKESYKLFECDALKAFSFKFIDDENRVLKLTSKPSFMHLSISNMKNEEYQIQLSGHIKSGESEITFDLPNQVNLSVDGNWKMACSNISLPPINVDAELSMTISYNKKSPRKILIYETRSPDFIIQSINNELAIIFGAGNVFLNMVNNKISLVVYVETDIFISRPLALILGFQDNIITNDGLLLSFNEQPAAITPERNVDVDRKVPQPSVLVLTCDVIDPVIFNNKYKPVLKILPIKTPGVVTFHEMKRLDFITITPSTLSSIKLSFENEDGNAITFRPNMKMSVCLTIVRT